MPGGYWFVCLAVTATLLGLGSIFPYLHYLARYDASAGEFGYDLERLLALLSTRDKSIPATTLQGKEVADCILIEDAIQVEIEERPYKGKPKAMWPEIRSIAVFKEDHEILLQFGFADEEYDRYFSEAHANLAKPAINAAPEVSALA